MSLTGRSRSRWTERNTRARPGPWSLSPEAPATGFANPSADPARILVVATPDAIRMVEELFQLEWAGQTGVEAGLEHAAVDPAAVAALYARYDSELVAG